MEEDENIRDIVIKEPLDKRKTGFKKKGIGKTGKSNNMIKELKQRQKDAPVAENVPPKQSSKEDEDNSVRYAGLITELTNAINRRAVGEIDDTALQVIANRIVGDVSSVVSSSTYSVIKPQMSDLSPYALLKYLENFAADVYPRLGKYLINQTNRLSQLSEYEKDIRGYIDKSRNLISGLPYKLQNIVNDMKQEQATAYAKLKQMARVEHKDRIYTEVGKYPSNVVELGAFNEMFGDLKNGAGEVISYEKQRFVIQTCFPRAFYIKLPSILNGVPYQINVFSGRLDDASMIIPEERYMSINRLPKRVYNFKYKAWWGPMVRIINDAYNFKNDEEKMIFIVLRLSASDDVLNRINEGVITSYNLPSRQDYFDYCLQLAHTRTLNFKAKRTAQRFVKNKMAKFLNTDKQIVSEIAQYTNIAVK